MAKGQIKNAYEEARRQRLEENKRRFQELGFAKISQSLNEKVNKPPVKDQVKSKKATINLGPLRRSSRPRCEIIWYDERFVTYTPRRRRFRSSSSTSYIARRVATEAERTYSLNLAKRFQSCLSSGNPSCVKSLYRSNVSGSNFLLHVPREFSKDHFPSERSTIVLEDEEGSTYDTEYLGERTRITVGWRSFARDHELDDGDALVLELIEPRRLKVYIFRVPNSVTEAKDDGVKKVRENKSVRKVTNSDADEDMADMDAEQIARPDERRTRRS